MKLFSFSLLICCLAVFSGCDDGSCVNTNPVLSSKTSAAPEYQNELAKMIDSSQKEHIVYHFESYKEVNGKEYIVVNVKGKDFCGTTDFAVNDWNKIPQLKSQGGYRGAILKGFQFDVVDNPGGKTFVFKDLDEIVD